jgi:tetratricopeptide (TPR) repeat protein
MSQQDDIRDLIAKQSRDLQELREQAKQGKLAVRHNLDREPPYFFGRDKLLEGLIQELLSLNQVIILRGFGGIGKSTLAKKIAYHCLGKGLFGMIAWVDVRRYRETQRIDLNTVLDVIARVYDPRTAIAQIGDLQQKSDEVIRMLSQHAALLVFDNFESIVHSNEELAICDFIDRLPMALSGLAHNTSIVRVIITTRQLSENLARLQPRIHIIQELSFQDTKKLVDRKIEDLSLSLRLGDQYTRFYEITCGIPKLTEFAVGQLRYLPFDEIQEHFAFRPPSEGSDDIYDYLFRRTWEEILSEEQKLILMGMTFFVEHAPRDAIAATAGINTKAFGRFLKDLCDMSLLDVSYHDEDMIYKAHPLTQRMCEAQISSDPDFAEAAARRFIEYYLQYSKRYYRSDQLLMEREVRNIIAAVELAEKLAEWDTLTSFRDSLNYFLWLAGYWPERIDANKSILNACRQSGSKSLEAKVLVEDIGFTYLRFEDIETAEQYVSEGLEIYQKLDDKRGVALATRHLGKSALLKGEYELLEPGHSWEDYFRASSELYSRSLSLREEISQSDPAEGIAIADLELDFGRLYWLWGRKCERDGRRDNKPESLRQALELYDRSISASERGKALFQEHGNYRGLSKALGNLGNVVKQRGLFYTHEGRKDEAASMFDQARSFYAESLKIAQTIHKIDEIAHAKWGLAEIYELYSDLQDGDRQTLASALELAMDSHKLYSQMATPADKQVTGELVDRIRGKLGQSDKNEPLQGEPPMSKVVSISKGAESMLEAISIPILMKAVDFLFEESRKILQERRERRQAEPQQAQSSIEGVERKTADRVQTKEELLTLELSQSTWSSYKDEIQHLLSLKETYARNYQLAKEQYAKWTGSLVPPIIVHNTARSHLTWGRLH